MHNPKHQTLIRFALLVAVFLCYFGYLSWEFDIVTGGLVAVSLGVVEAFQEKGG